MTDLRLAQGRNVEKYQPGAIAEALRNGDTRCAEEYWHAKITGKAQAWHWRPDGYEQLTGDQRNADLELDETSFRSNKNSN